MKISLGKLPFPEQEWERFRQKPLRNHTLMGRFPSEEWPDIHSKTDRDDKYANCTALGVDTEGGYSHFIFRIQSHQGGRTQTGENTPLCLSQNHIFQVLQSLPAACQAAHNLNPQSKPYGLPTSGGKITLHTNWVFLTFSLLSVLERGKKEGEKDWIIRLSRGALGSLVSSE